MSYLRALLLLALAASVASAAELKTLKGQVVKGDLVSITDKEIVIDADGKKVSIPVKEVLLLNLREGEKPSTDPYSEVELNDGTILRCARVVLTGKQAKLHLMQGQEVTLPLSKIKSILNEAHKDQHRKEWKEKVLGKKRVRDVLFRPYKDVLNAYEGTFGDADAKGEKIEFTLPNSDERKTVTLAEITGLYFQRGAETRKGLKEFLCKVHDTSGNLVFATGVSRTAEGFTVTTTDEVTIKYGKENVARLDYSTGKLTFLSSLTPASVKETSTEDRIVHYRRDENFDGGKISLAGKTYEQGLCLHSTTELEYDLEGGEYREFKALAGFDEIDEGENVAEGGTVLKIYGDGQELLSMTFNRNDKERARPILLNVKDIKKLKVVVTTEDLLDYGKRLALADARVSK